MEAVKFLKNISARPQKERLPSPPIISLTPEQIVERLRSNNTKDEVGIWVPNPARIIYEIQRFFPVLSPATTIRELRRAMASGSFMI